MRKPPCGVGALCVCAEMCTWSYPWVDDKPTAGDACLLSQARSGLLEGGGVMRRGIAGEGEWVEQGGEERVRPGALALLTLDAAG